MRVQMRDAGKLSSTTMAGISMTETIKASGAELGFFRKWSGYQASVNTGRVKYTTLNAKWGLIPQFISILSNQLVMFMGVYLTMNGKFTIGMITSFQGFLSAFMGPAMVLVGAGQTIQEMRTSMERVEDVMEYPDDPALFYGDDIPDKYYAKLGGEIELKNVTFGYSRLGNAAVTDFSMHVKPGDRIAIVGASGCGKSTISKLITGLYRPWSGEILFDGKPISQIPRNVFTGSVAMVDQDIVLFEDTISNNMTISFSARTDTMRSLLRTVEISQAVRDSVSRSRESSHRILQSSFLMKRPVLLMPRQSMNLSRLLRKET